MAASRYIQGVDVPKDRTSGAVAITKDGGRVVDVIDNTTVYPYTASATVYGLAVINRGSDTVSFDVGSLTITVAPNESFDADFEPFTEIDVTAGTSFEMVLRG